MRLSRIWNCQNTSNYLLVVVQNTNTDDIYDSNVKSFAGEFEFEYGERERD